MTTTTDLIDICSLYFTQAVRRYEYEGYIARVLGRVHEADDLYKKYTLRCYMYVLAGAMVIGGEY